MIVFHLRPRCYGAGSPIRTLEEGPSLSVLPLRASAKSPAATESPRGAGMGDSRECAANHRATGPRRGGHDQVPAAGRVGREGCFPAYRYLMTAGGGKQLRPDPSSSAQCRRCPIGSRTLGNKSPRQPGRGPSAVAIGRACVLAVRHGTADGDMLPAAISVSI
jgi:hypothetical protein